MLRPRKGTLLWAYNILTLILPTCPNKMYECWENVGRIDSFINFNPDKRSPDKFSILYHTAGYKLKGEVCIWSAVGAERVKEFSFSTHRGIPPQDSTSCATILTTVHKPVPWTVPCAHSLVQLWPLVLKLPWWTPSLAYPANDTPSEPLEEQRTNLSQVHPHTELNNTPDSGWISVTRGK